MVKIKKQLVSADIMSRRSYGKGNPIKGIVVHQTGNTNKGANAEMHARLQSRLNPRQASWHYQVDDKDIIQSFNDGIMCWHATDGRGPGNTEHLAIELCVNGDADYKKTIANGAKLVALKLKEHNLTINDVKQHHEFYNKNCPAQLRSGHKGITWDDFLNMVKPKAKLKVDGSWGPATTRALQRYLGTTVDGVISGQPTNRSTRNIPSAEYGTGGSELVRAMQRHYNSGVVDGVISGTSNLITAMQKHYDLEIVDGYVSNPSNLVKAVQRILNAGRL